MKIYYVQKPSSPYPEWIKFFAIRTLFPIVGLWDISRALLNRIADRAIKKIMHPSPVEDTAKYLIKNVAAYNSDELTNERSIVMSHDGAALDTWSISHLSQENLPTQTQKYIIYFIDVQHTYGQYIDQMQADAAELQSNVIAFNFRKNGHIEIKDYLTDGVSQVQRLINQGVSPKNITLKAYSFSGILAVLVTQYFQDSHKPIKLLCDRSSLSMGALVLERMGLSILGSIENPYLNRLVTIARPFVRKGLTMAQHTVNANAPVFKETPRKLWNYLLMKARRESGHTTVPEESFISHFVLIHAALKKEQQQTTEVLPQIVVHTNEEHKELALTPMQKDNVGKMETSLNQESHFDSLARRRDHYETSTLTFFLGCVEQILDDQGELGRQWQKK